MRRAIPWILLAAAVLTGTLIWVFRPEHLAEEPLNTLPREAGAKVEVDNVAVVDGKQVIDILAKRQYTPRLTVAKAGMPTVLRLKTDGTIDCTAAVTIPSLRYRRILPANGVTEVALPAQAAGSILQGICTMGMYGFTIRFV